MSRMVSSSTSTMLTRQKRIRACAMTCSRVRVSIDLFPRLGGFRYTIAVNYAQPRNEANSQANPKARKTSEQIEYGSGHASAAKLRNSAFVVKGSDREQGYLRAG